MVQIQKILMVYFTKGRTEQVVNLLDDVIATHREDAKRHQISHVKHALK